MSGRPAPFLTRLWAKVSRGEGCWEWTAAIGTHGYGVLGVGGRKAGTVLAHRATYEALVGPIPAGLTLDHLCRNRRCVNPAHLEPVTHAENIARTPKALRTHCPNGHPFSEAVRRASSRGRDCLTCARDYSRSYRQQRRLAKQSGATA